MKCSPPPSPHAQPQGSIWVPYPIHAKRLNDAPLTSQAIDVCTQEGAQGIAISPRARRHGKRVRRALSFFLSVNQQHWAHLTRGIYSFRVTREREKKKRRKTKKTGGGGGG